MIQFVTKRDGTKVPFNSYKIDFVIEYACRGLEVNAAKLHENFYMFLYEDIKTSAIQDLLVQKAEILISIEEPDWRIVTGRLKLLNLYKKAKETNGHDNFGYPGYYDFVVKAVKNNLYTSRLLDVYTEAEIRSLEKHLDYDLDLTYDIGRITSLEKRYLKKLNGKVFELPQHMYATMALMHAINLPRSTRLNKVVEYYLAMVNRKLSPATPVCLNLRAPNGNLASCFITAVDDSWDAISHVATQVGSISKNAGGVGILLSYIRAFKSWIKDIKGVSGGISPWAKIYNDIAVAVNQQGKRAGAFTLALDCWHLDFPEFLQLQNENGDQRHKAYDVLLQCVFNDTFFNFHEFKRDWYLFDPYEIKTKFGINLPELYGGEFTEVYVDLIRKAKNGEIELFNVVKTGELIKHALISAVEVGQPYWFNKDTVNKYNPNKHVGFVGCGNLCQESWSNFKPTTNIQEYIDGSVLHKTMDLGYAHVCNLNSIVLSQIKNDAELEKYVKLGVEMLDNLIDIGTPPISEAQIHNDEYRIIGLGVMGLHEYITSHGIQYSESVDFCSKLFEKIAFWALEKSCELARERGQYKYYEGSDWSKGIYFGHSFEYGYFNSSSLDWAGLHQKIQKYGIRNGGLLAIAPNTSTSILIGTSASVLPVYDVFFKDVNSIGSFPILPSNIKEPGIMWLYESFKTIDPYAIIDVCSSIQKWVDQGISMELPLDLDRITSAKELAKIYLYAMRSNCKTIYYLRTKDKTKTDSCSTCAN